MIRIWGRLATLQSLRCTQYCVHRMCSNKSDDAPSLVHEPFDREPETSASNASSSVLAQNVNQNKLNIEKALLQLFENLPSEPTEVSKTSLVEFYERITGSFLITKDAIEHPKFKVLHEATKSLAMHLTYNEIKNVFVAIVPSKTVMHHDLSRIIVDTLLKKATSEIRFDQIIFLDFMLNRYYKTTELSTHYNNLRLKLQTFFLADVDEELDRSIAIDELIRIVAYCGNNAEVIPSRIVNRLTTYLLLLDDEDFTVGNITSIIIFLANFGKLNEHVGKLLHRVLGLWCQLPVTASDVLSLFRVLASKSKTLDVNMFKDSDFISQSINTVIREANKNISFGVQNSFNKIGVGNVELIDHLSKYFESGDEVRKLTAAEYIVFCRACYRTKYKPSNWQTAILPTIKTFQFSRYFTSLGSFDWAKFAIHLNSLGHCDVRLIQAILKSRYLQKKTSHDPAKLETLRDILKQKGIKVNASDDSVSEVSSSSSGKHALADDLKSMLGESIWPNLQIDQKTTIPFVLKIDKNSGSFLPISKEPSIKNLPDNELLIGVIVIPEVSKEDMLSRMTYGIKEMHRMSKFGITSIVIDERKWFNLKAYEKSLEFYTQIVHLMKSHEEDE